MGLRLKECGNVPIPRSMALPTAGRHQPNGPVCRNTNQTGITMNRFHRVAGLLAASFLAITSLVSPAWANANLPPELQAKVEKAKKLLTDRAADPAIVAAVRDANARGPGAMTNGTWIELEDGAPAVKAVLSTGPSRQIAAWETADKTINKIVLRDNKGNLIAASVRPLIFNNANRAVFSKPFEAQQPWAAGEIKPDPTTQIPSVHVAAPVMDGGKAIGVLQAGVSAQ